MIYDFDKLINRHHTNSMKWDVDDMTLSMDIADMDFKTAPVIIEAIKNKAEFGVLGYHNIPKAYYEGYCNWWRKHHNFTMNDDWMIFSTGVVPAISSIVRKITTVGENVLVQAPVYNIFYNSIINNGRKVLSSDLVYKDNKYTVDFDDLESKLSDSQTTLMILCNPHNPIGKVWEKETLEKIGDLCHKYNVVVLSDEIHCDITQNNKYTPFASINDYCRDNSITCLSVSKAFNLAGLQSACIVVPNENLRNKVNRGLNTDEVAEPNAFVVDATLAAFRGGEEWLKQLKSYIEKNKAVAEEYISNNITKLKLVKSDATYLLWIDCEQITNSTALFCDFLELKIGLKISEGSMFGDCGKQFIRMNIACPTKRMLEGLEKLKRGVEEF